MMNNYQSLRRAAVGLNQLLDGTDPSTTDQNALADRYAFITALGFLMDLADEWQRGGADADPDPLFDEHGLIVE